MIYAIDDVALPRSDWTFRESPVVPRSNALTVPPVPPADVQARLDDSDSNGRELVIEGKIEAPLKADQTLPEASSELLAPYVALKAGGKPHSITIDGRTFAAVRLNRVAAIAEPRLKRTKGDPGGLTVVQRVRFTWGAT
jgi:hypothetical protein